MLPNIPEYVISYYGILNAGAVAVPLNGLLQGPEVTHHLDDSDAVAFLVWEDFLETARKGYEEAENCKSLIVVESPDGEGVTEDVVSFEELLSEQKDGVRRGSDHARRHGGRDLHQRHYGPAEGRGAFALQPFLQRRLQGGQAPQTTRGRRRDGRAPTLPHLRPVHRNERRHLLRQHHRHGPALRAGSGARNDTEQMA